MTWQLWILLFGEVLLFLPLNLLFLLLLLLFFLLLLLFLFLLLLLFRAERLSLLVSEVVFDVNLRFDGELLDIFG